MTSRMKLQNALEHKSTKVPIDFGATAVTGMHCSIVEELRNYYGLEKKPIKIQVPNQMLGTFDPDLIEALEIDVIGIFNLGTIFGFTNTEWKEWKTPWGQEVLVPGDFNVTYEGGNVFIYPEGDITAPASGQMPEGGFFFDSIIRQKPIFEDKLDPKDNLEEFRSISEESLKYLHIACIEAEKTGKGIVAAFGGSSLGDVSAIPGAGLKKPKGIRDITEWYISIAARQDYIHEVFKGQTEMAIKNLEKIFLVVGNIPQVVFVSGTDFGTQISQFCSKETFESLYAPYFKQINDWIHKNTTWKSFCHSCGAIDPLLPSMIEAGFDVINPVQCSATGMDPEHLKEKYGRDVVFWGGGIDTQKTLPFGSPEDIKNEVWQRLKIFSTGGGFIFNAIHNVQALTPVENVVALVETVKEFNNHFGD